MSLVVDTDLGRVQGVYDQTGAGVARVRVFRGIPFAAPPVGRRRFGAPEPALPWPGVLSAESFGAAPMQAKGGPFSGVIPGSDVGQVDEDCLTLNVWTPDGHPSGLPVMMWVYGGAFLSGGTRIETYDAARLCAEQEVVVVSANYRLGALGFLWLGGHGGAGAGAAANPGLLDQLAAMHWVRQNIAGFGGDPDLLTVFGESAGAGCLLHLHTSPLAAGLFRRLICQSAAVDHTLVPDTAEVVTAALMTTLEVGSGAAAIDKLRELPAAALVEAQVKCLPVLMRSVSSMPFHPVVDGRVLTEKPSVAVDNGAGFQVEMLLTWTADELRLFPNGRADELARDGLIRWTRRYLSARLGDDVPAGRAAQLVDYYRASEAARGRTRWAYVWAALSTDGAMRLPARRIAESRLGPGAARTYCAEFDWPAARGGDWERGAFHAIDLPFVFGTLGRGAWAEFLGAGDEARDLSGEMRAAWAAFARSGQPSGPATGPWPAYRSPERATVLLDTPCAIAHDPLGNVDRLWEGLWSPQGGPAGFI